MKSLNLKKYYPTLLIVVPLLTAAAFSTANGGFFGGIASAGYGGQESSYKHTFTANSAVFNVTLTEREIDYRNAGGSLICNPSGITVANLGTMGTLTQADILPGAKLCNPNIQTLQHLIQAMREGKISFGTTPLVLSGTTETPGNQNPSPSTYNPSITPSNAQVRAGSSLDFKGTNFAREENVTISRNGTQVGQAHADGGGNFTTGSIMVPSTPGTYTYTFTGSISNKPTTSTIMVQ